MYHKAYGIIETLAPLHVGASAGEETGNLNLIFRDQFTQTGIIPGSSIRGRFRADMHLEGGNVDFWYGAEASSGGEDKTSEGIAKFEYASILWLPVYCPGQPVVRVSCPTLLKRYQKLKNGSSAVDAPHKFQHYSYYGKAPKRKTLFFNLGFLPLQFEDKKLNDFIPSGVSDADEYLLYVVKDTEMSMIHDMALYRQSRVALGTDTDPTLKKASRGAFFHVEALPEGTVMIFPIALRKTYQGESISSEKFLQDAKMSDRKELYFGGLESIGFGRTNVKLNIVKEA
jgi:CRISPR-associated protein Cmr4